jgi:type IV pilus assembly protein PilA
MKDGRRRDERGFTIVELMIVILIIGILIAIALPTYLGARAQAADRAAEADMRTGLAAALAYYSDHGDWTGFDSSAAHGEEAHLDWIDAPGPPIAGQVEIHIASGQDLLLIGRSQSGTSLCLAQVAGAPATVRGQGATYASVNTTAACSGGW